MPGSPSHTAVDRTSSESLVRVSIVEDDRISRENLAALIERAPGLRLLETFADAESAIAGVAAAPPDVLVVDMKLAPPGSGRLSGADCVAAVKRTHPRVEALMLTVYNDHKLVIEALEAGASGYILKRSSTAEIIDAIWQLHQGGAPFSMQAARQVVEHFHRPRQQRQQNLGLTPREYEILEQLAQGLPAHKIATHLGVVEGTVRVHLQSIYRKLNVSNRTEAVLRFLGHSQA
jgi:DNA-binding NarL/FixJ family response regulator